MSKGDWRVIFDYVETHPGYRVVAENGHRKIQRYGKEVLSCPGTASDPRSIDNFIGDLRRKCNIVYRPKQVRTQPAAVRKSRRRRRAARTF